MSLEASDPICTVERRHSCLNSISTGSRSSDRREVVCPQPGDLYPLTAAAVLGAGMRPQATGKCTRPRPQRRGALGPALDSQSRGQGIEC